MKLNKVNSVTVSQKPSTDTRVVRNHRSPPGCRPSNTPSDPYKPRPKQHLALDGSVTQVFTVKFGCGEPKSLKTKLASKVVPRQGFLRESLEISLSLPKIMLHPLLLPKTGLPSRKCPIGFWMSRFRLSPRLGAVGDLHMSRTAAVPQSQNPDSSCTWAWYPRSLNYGCLWTSKAMPAQFFLFAPAVLCVCIYRYMHIGLVQSLWWATRKGQCCHARNYLSLHCQGNAFL